MLGYLVSPGELRHCSSDSATTWTAAVWRGTVDCYLRRTSHGSTPSGLVHGRRHRRPTDRSDARPLMGLQHQVADLPVSWRAENGSFEGEVLDSGLSSAVGCAVVPTPPFVAAGAPLLSHISGVGETATSLP